MRRSVTDPYTQAVLRSRPHTTPNREPLCLGDVIALSINNFNFTGHIRRTNQGARTLCQHVRSRHTIEQLNKPSRQPTPPCLMTSPNPRAIIPMEVFVEQQMVAPVRIRLKLLRIPSSRSVPNHGQCHRRFCSAVIFHCPSMRLSFSSERMDCSNTCGPAN